MIQEAKICEWCKIVKHYVVLNVIYNKDHSCAVNLPYCPECKIIKVTHRELMKWFPKEKHDEKR